eukprot:scaffold7207_cov520-Prasinococcus_capsulatus_cf.AAC.24
MSHPDDKDSRHDEDISTGQAPCARQPKVAVLVQTCDKYKWVWPAWSWFYRKFWRVEWRTFLLTEEASPQFTYANQQQEDVGTQLWKPYGPIESLPCGCGLSFSERLKRGLEFLLDQGFEQVLYLQDDFWVFRSCFTEEWEALARHVQKHRMSFLRILNAQELRSIGSGQVVARPSGLFLNGTELLQYDARSPFLFSHQASLWPTKLMYAVVATHDDGDAYRNEILGTRRLQRMFRGKERELRAYGYPLDCYRATVGHPGIGMPIPQAYLLVLPAGKLRFSMMTDVTGGRCIGPAGKLNGFGEALLKAQRSLLASGLLVNGAREHLLAAHDVCEQSLLPFDNHCAQESLIRELLVKQAVASGGVACRTCRQRFTSFSDYYSDLHDCIDSEDFFKHNRPA